MDEAMNIKSEIWGEKRNSVKKIISGTKSGKSITNKNYYNWSLYKNYKCEAQKGDEAK